MLYQLTAGLVQNFAYLFGRWTCG